MLKALSAPPGTDVAHVALSMGEGPRPDFDARRERALALLRADARLAFVVDDDTTDPVILAVAIRRDGSVFTCEVEVPKASFKMLVLAVIEGSKGKSSPAEQAKRLDSGKEAA